jgi:hypothetical protein
VPVESLETVSTGLASTGAGVEAPSRMPVNVSTVRVVVINWWVLEAVEEYFFMLQPIGFAMT